MDSIITGMNIKLIVEKYSKTNPYINILPASRYYKKDCPELSQELILLSDNLTRKVSNRVRYKFQYVIWKLKSYLVWHLLTDRITLSRK